MNFLVLSLCDNDYGYDLLKAIEYAKEQSLYDFAGEDVRWWKEYVIRFVEMSKLLIHPPSWDTSLSRPYLEERLSVYFSQKWPTYDGVTPIDHDGGSLVFDLNTQIISLV